MGDANETTTAGTACGAEAFPAVEAVAKCSASIRRRMDSAGYGGPDVAASWDDVAEMAGDRLGRYMLVPSMSVVDVSWEQGFVEATVRMALLHPTGVAAEGHSRGSARVGWSADPYGDAARAAAASWLAVTLMLPFAHPDPDPGATDALQEAVRLGNEAWEALAEGTEAREDVYNQVMNLTTQGRAAYNAWCTRQQLPTTPKAVTDHTKFSAVSVAKLRAWLASTEEERAADDERPFRDGDDA